MLSRIHQRPFYFVRHGLTDHNVYQIYDDNCEVKLNQKGVEQAIKLQQVLSRIPITTVCSSPMLRVQQTKELILKGGVVKDFLIDDFRECPSALWRLFLASESRSLTTQEWEPIQGFINRVEKGLLQSLQYDDPLLLIAHGGTYWALSHLLKLDGNKKIDNCILVKILPHSPNKWKTQFLS